MYNLVDLSNLKWSTSNNLTNNSITGGSYFKTKNVENGVLYYYKCSCYYENQKPDGMSISFGDESINEVICSRLFSKLGFNCVKYKLVYAKVNVNGNICNTFVCKSRDYYKGYDSRVYLDTMVKLDKSHNVFKVTDRLGVVNDLKKIIIADFIVGQRDRHGSNIELLCKNDDYSLAPIFDNGICFLTPSYVQAFNKDVSNFDVKRDFLVNNYIGDRSLYSNLRLINKSIKVNRLTNKDRRSIFYGLSSAMSKSYLDKIWEMITFRYTYLKKGGYIYEA